MISYNARHSDNVFKKYLCHVRRIAAQNRPQTRSECNNNDRNEL